MWFPIEFSCELYNSCSPLDILSMKFIAYASIGHWSSGCHNSPCLPKSKSYMKIIRLLYKTNQEVIASNYIEDVLKELHLFKDVVLASKPCVIKASPKSNMAVVLQFQNLRVG